VIESVSRMASITAFKCKVSLSHDDGFSASAILRTIEPIFICIILASFSLINFIIYKMPSVNHLAP